MAEKKSILIVEDDPAVVQQLLELMGHEVYSISIATDGIDAFEKLRQDKYDLLICDIWIPGMSGFELLAATRELPEQMNVIIMTADDTPATMMKAVREQAHHFVNKPFQPEEMRTLIHATLEGPPAPPIEVVSAKPEWVELLVPCEARSVDRIQGLLSKLKADLPAEVRESVSQAFRELLMNAIEWGGKLDANRQVRISYLRAKRMLIYRIADPGLGFKFAELAHAAVGNASGDPVGHLRIREEMGLRPGGLGILLTKSLVDELLYNEAQNEVVFVKYLD